MMNKANNIFYIIINLIIIGILIFSLIAFGSELSLITKLLIIFISTATLVMIVFNIIEFKEKGKNEKR